MAFAYALLFIIRYGYAFGTGDHEEHLPPVYKLLNPNLYNNDFFMKGYLNEFNIRFYFIHTVYFLQYLIPINYLFFFGLILCIATLSYFWIKISYLLTQNYFASIITPLFMLFVFYSFTLGSNRITYNIFIAGVLAKVFASGGLYNFLNKKYIVSGLLFGVGTLFQILSAGQCFFITSVSMFFLYKEYKLKNILLFNASFFLVALFVIVPVFSSYLVPASNQEKQLFAAILYYFRAPWHYLPHKFPLADYVKYLTVFIPAVILIYRNVNANKFVFTFILVQTVMCIIYTIFIYGFNSYVLVKSQWFKSTLWVNALSCVFIVAFLTNRFKHINLHLLLNKFKVYYAIPIVVGVFFIVLFYTKNTSFQIIRNRIMFGNYPLTDLQKTHQWIKSNTPLDALFIIPPDDISFSCEAQRNLLVSPHAFIHNVSSTISWYKWYNKIYGVSVKNLANQKYRDVAVKNYKQTPIYNYADYRIDNISTRNADSIGFIVYRNSTYKITKINNSSSSTNKHP